ncbi:MAG: entericidin A/B family lipoprotein [Phycisphaerae bacterium]|nr:entericidin A/B family lipoprotein [Gammaproteobacteria bacterium]NIR47309.1 entericidin A/B family lipoprotein [candidate division KSB1 bacterium]NIV00782.1 entericidin A/B family lipoprotein [Phycisphaerae bacterium]NIQ09839.1 entericidin A/B family lipoprotein [Gammaproteobacteria bacterium]NIS22902.1 entericidin A/B family lipoprotein [candidate division KSB1 bacterium]
MKKLLVILSIGVMVFSLSACETMKGLGKDVEDAGEWVQDKAD